MAESHLLDMIYDGKRPNIGESEQSPLSSPSNDLFKKREEELIAEKRAKEILQNQKLKELEEARMKAEEERKAVEEQALEARRKAEAQL
jgi:hypothetical protein